ncbi:unnamed protein product [Prorocentrum cordatum]|uniref:DUF5710 domain-containing protein n=1 Tax=Prorocentrum cordatum TaxID=2364126 RepID=A0ABN9XS89_9DINO|nr:unnamed protein product [Polarella glacialis]
MSGGQGGATAFAFGKHRGRTFDEVRRQELAARDEGVARARRRSRKLEDPRYVQWARKEARTGALGDFVAYCDAAEGRPPHGAPAAARPPLGGPAAAGRPSAGGAPDGRSPPQKRGIDGGTDQAGASPSPKRRLSTASTAASSPTAGAAAAGDGPRTCEKCDSENLPFPGAFRCGPCWREHFQSVDEPFFLRCPVTEKDEAKRRGAWWHPEMKKWYVPAGRDISLLERWFVRCARCGEGLSDHPRMRYNPGSQADPPACRPECASDRLQREEAELEERERQEVAEMQQQQKEEAERRREAMKKRIKADYLSSLRAEARAIQDMIAAKNERIAAEDGSAGVPLQIPAGGLVDPTLIRSWL